MANSYDAPSSHASEQDSDSSPAPAPTKLSFAQKMMAKMGHVEGQGLGAKGEGRVEPVEATTTIGRWGIGSGTVTADEYLEHQNNPWKAAKQKTSASTVQTGKPSRFVRVTRLAVNTHPSMLLTMFDAELRSKVKEISSYPHEIAVVEFESEEDAVKAASKYSGKAFGWNGQKADLQCCTPDSYGSRCTHSDSPWGDKEHSRKCRLSIYLRELEEEKKVKSSTVLITGLNEHHEISHVSQLLGEQDSEGWYDECYDVQFDEEHLWDVVGRPGGIYGSALVRFHTGNAQSHIDDWNGRYFKNSTIYLKYVPDFEYDAIARKKSEGDPKGKLHMNNLPQGAGIDYIRSVLHKYKVGDQTFLMGARSAVVYLEMIDMNDILSRYPHGLRYQGSEHYFSEWVGGKKGKSARAGPPPRSAPLTQPNSLDTTDLSKQVAGLSLGSDLGPKSDNWRSRTPSRNRGPEGATQVIVRNLAYTATEQDIRQLFGKMSITRIAQKKGFAFVTLSTPEQAQEAIRQLSGRQVLGRKVSVETVRAPK